MAKKEIKQEQVLNVEEAVGRTEAFINKNWKILAGAVAVIIIAVVGYFWYVDYKADKELKAAEALFPGEQYFAKGDFESALNGDQEFPGLEAVAEEFSSTKAGQLAKAYAGISLAKLGRYEEAIPMLNAYAGNDMMVAPSVLGALGNCYAQTGDNAKAASTLMKAAKKASNNVLSPVYLIQAGQIYEALGQKADALNAYKQVKEKYYTSTQAMDIDKYIERVK